MCLMRTKSRWPTDRRYQCLMMTKRTVRLIDYQCLWWGQTDAMEHKCLLMRTKRRVRLMGCLWWGQLDWWAVPMSDEDRLMEHQCLWWGPRGELGLIGPYLMRTVGLMGCISVSNDDQGQLRPMGCINVSDDDQEDSQTRQLWSTVLGIGH
jgi:hypothetical protein